jgi:hypothetical protein
MANMPSEEKTLIEGAVAQLREMLPAGWKVAPSDRAYQGADPGGASQAKTIEDRAIDLTPPQGGMTTFAVEARPSFDPRTAERLLTGLAGTIRTLGGNPPILAVAPWMSARTQELLAREDISYLDLTGNARIHIAYPPIYIKTAGATRNPRPAPRGRAGVRGPRAARLIRLLADVAPPYGVSEIALATGLAAGYVSRLLDTLDREALVERSPRGRVEAVDIQGLLRRWAQSYDAFKANRASSFIARSGTQSALGRLSRVGTPVAVTGSFAAARLAPVAAPALLVAYGQDVAGVAEALGLLPASEGANVVLLQPFDPVVWERLTKDGDLRYVAPSQVAVDCLTGTGRMPAEGEALLGWMLESQQSWRLPSIDALASGEIG